MKEIFPATDPGPPEREKIQILWKAYEIRGRIHTILSYFEHFLRFLLCVCVCTLECMSTGALRSQKRASRLLELELQEVVSHLKWVLGTELRSSAVGHGLTTEPSLQLS